MLHLKYLKRISKRVQISAMHVLGGVVLFFIITWLALFCHAAWDILSDLRMPGVVPLDERDTVNVCVEDYGTSLQDEYCDDGV